MKNIKIQALSVGALLLLAGCGAETETPDVSTEMVVDDTTSMDSTAESSVDTSEEEEVKGIQNREFGYTLTQAIEMFDETFPDSSIKSIDLTERNSEFVYKFEGFDNEMEYTLILDAETGEVIDKDQDDDDIEDRVAINLDDIISPQEAMEKALVDTPTGTYVEDWELEMNDESTVYDLDVKYPSGSPGEDLKVNAQTGEVIVDDNLD